MNVKGRRAASKADLEEFEDLAMKLWREEKIKDNWELMVYRFDDMVVPQQFGLDGSLAVQRLLKTDEFLVAIPAPLIEGLDWEDKEAWDELLRRLLRSWQEWSTKVNGIPAFKPKEQVAGPWEPNLCFNPDIKTAAGREAPEDNGKEGMAALLIQLATFMRSNHFNVECYIAAVEEDTFEIRVDFYADIEAGIPRDGNLMGRA